MYPCSNPELVAGVSKAGGIGIIQPVTLTYVCGYSMEEGLDYLKQLTHSRIGMNVIVENSSKKYQSIMEKWLEIALEAGIRFFVTSLGSPRWVVEKCHQKGGFVYHDVTSRKWALKAIEAGVDGLIAVNSRAGGHAGESDAASLYATLEDLRVPVIAAGGIASHRQYRQCLEMGYAGVQVGTCLIASEECSATIEYKQALCQATSQDIVRTQKISGVPVSVINTHYVQKVGTQVSWLTARLLKHPKLKHWIRRLLHLRAIPSLSRSSLQGYRGYWQAGQSVDDIHQILPVAQILKNISGADETST